MNLMEETRIRLMLDYPFFGVLTLSLPMIRTNDYPTISTNGEAIFYNQKFIESLNKKELLFIFMHEIGHIILLHIFRRGNRQHRIWNVACDFAVNILLENLPGMQMPASVLYNPKYNNMSAEQIYDELVKEEKQKKSAQPPGRGLVPKSGEMRDGDMGDTGDPDREIENDKRQDSGDPEAEIPEDAEFSEELRRLVEISEKHGTVEDAPESISEPQVKSAICSAIAINEMSGDIKITSDTALGREIEKLTDKKIPWQSLLQRFITETCHSDYSWMKPNLKYRQVSKGFILPSIESKKEIKLAVVFDTSGSIDKKKCSSFFAQFLNMINSIEFKELHVLSCSDEIFNPKVFHKHDKIEYEPQGTGGTSAAPVWRYLKEQGTVPNCLVYFTDLAIFNYGEDPGYPVVWIVHEEDSEIIKYYKQNLPFGEVIHADKL